MAVSYSAESLGLSIRKACSLVGLGRSSYTYQPKPDGDGPVRQRLRELAQQRRRFGSPQLHVLLRREGLVINHKRTERLYREEGLSLRRRGRRHKRAPGARASLPVAQRPNQRRSMDFATDTIVTGRRFRAIAVVDDFSRECPAIEIDTSLGGARVVVVLDRLADTRGLPEVITMDNGPESAGRALDEWAYPGGVRLNFISPGKPIDNAFAESFIGRLRHKCLNDNWFMSLRHARDVIETWRLHYDDFRPHISLAGLTPGEFAATKAGL